MSRRLAGVALMVLTIIGTVVIASLPGRRVAGTAVSVAFPDAPQIGDCLLDPRQGAGPDTAAAVRPLPLFGPCADGRATGEIVAVRMGPATDNADCVPEALRRAGLLRDQAGSFVLPGAPTDDPVEWSYRFAVSAFWLPQIPWLPSASTWAVCIAEPLGHRLDHGTIAGAFDDGRLPGDYGTCAQSMDVVSAIPQVNCNLPHVAELISSGLVAGTTSFDWNRIHSSCATQAALVMRRGDPTAGGELKPTALGIPLPGSQAALLVPCYLTASDGRMIVGSLVGLGSGQVTFTDAAGHPIGGG